jgi:hypothetical protein
VAVCRLGARPRRPTAADISSAELGHLAARAAAGDRSALARLRAADRVDGQPARLDLVLGTRNGAELSARLRTLSTSRAGRAVSATDAQAEAAAVLHARRYHNAPLPDPLATAFRKLGHLLSKLAGGAPGGPVAFWAAVAALVVGLALFGARRMLRRSEPGARTALLDPDTAGVDPHALERAAQHAEERGAYEDAVRLRFQAGLLMLGRRGALDYRPSLLTEEARRRLHSARFDALAARFEEVAYGGAAATAPDARAARDGWATVLAEER